MQQLIPKKIHYCWFGNKKLPKIAKKCMGSWEYYLGDYEVKRWDETNFDVFSECYTKEAYEAGKYAFVSDYVRLYALYHEGGIYMDTDVEVVKNLDRFLKHDAFSGFEGPDFIPTGIMAARKKHPWVEKILNYYRNATFESSKQEQVPNTVIITKLSLKDGLVLNDKKQTFNGVTIYPKDFFCPMDYDDSRFNLTENTHTIHHFSASWLSPKKKVFLWIKKKVLQTYFPFFKEPLQFFYRKYFK